MLTGCGGQEGQEGHQAKGVSVPPISPPRVPEMRPTVPTAGAIRGVRDEDKAGLSTAYGWRSNLSPGGVREDGGARRRCRGVRAVSGRIGLNRGHGVVMLRARQFARQCVLLQAAEEPAQGRNGHENAIAHSGGSGGLECAFGGSCADGCAGSVAGADGCAAGPAAWHWRDLRGSHRGPGHWIRDHDQHGRPAGTIDGEIRHRGRSSTQELGRAQLWVPSFARRQRVTPYGRKML